MNEVVLHVSPPVAAIEVDGRLDLIRAHDLRRAVEDALRLRCLHLTLDLSRVAAWDSVGVGTVVACRERVAAEGGELVVQRLSGPLSRVEALTGLTGATGRRSA